MKSFGVHMTLSYKQVGSVAVIALAVSLTLLSVVSPGATEKSGAFLKMKQLGLAGVAYAEDYDSMFPFAYGPDPTDSGIAYRYNRFMRVPQNWRPTDSAESAAADALGWANSMRPYYKDKSALEIPGVPIKPQTGVDYSAPNVPWQNVGLTFNGMLHSWPTYAITEPSRLTVFWQGDGNRNGAGFVISNPVLTCDYKVPCQFNPNGAPVSSRDKQYPWIWWSVDTPDIIDNHGLLRISADLSVTNRPTRQWEILSGANESFYTGATVNDSSSAFSEGKGYWMRECWRTNSSGGAEVSYPCFFMPDYDFQEVGR
ncbi:MAG: hypothetical protein ACAH95_12880 [Fimbriimonas sp.]